MNDLTAPARNANLDDLVALLQGQQRNKLDAVVPATRVRSQGGMWVIDGVGEPELTANGVTARPGIFRPTEVADEGISDKLGIPLSYVRKMRSDRPDLYDANVNGWLHGRRKRAADGTETVLAPADGRSFLVRTFRGVDGGPGVARALLSDGYKMIDNLDVLVAALDGIREAGVDVTFDGCDLTERRMRVRVVAPGVQALAPVLLRGYRSPFDNGARRVAAPWETEAGRAHGWLTPDEQPVIFAGFEIANSETGGGAFTLTPRMVVRVCRNGLTITADALRNVHLGAKMAEGVVRWSDDTRRANLELVTKQARDAVATFLDAEYVTAKVADLEAKAGHVLAHPAEQVEIVTNRLKLNESHAKLVLDHFLRGGQLTAGGVMHAVTSAAQAVDDPEAAADLEAMGLRALEVAAAL